MSKSLKRVKADLERLGIPLEIQEMPDTTRSAADAANAAGCGVDQIVKSIVFRGETSDSVYLFLTAGSNQVDPTQSAALAGEPLGKANAAFIRAKTGFAIGGVSPFGHLTPPRIFLDRSLLTHDHVWAAAGTPRHVFEIAPERLAAASGAEVADFI